MPELLDFKAKVDFTQARRDVEDFEKMLNRIGGISMSGAGKGFDSKPLTDYQKELLKIKQASLELAQQKQAQSAAEKSASLAIQESLQRERTLAVERNRQLVEARIAQIEKNNADKEALRIQKDAAVQANKRRPTQFSNSQAEVSAAQAGNLGNPAYTSVINAERVARAQLNTELAKQAIEQGNLTNTQITGTTATTNSTQAQNQNNLTRKQLAQLLAEEKYLQAQATAELKNNAREMLNAKGSIEQRRAALIRLIRDYDRLSAVERESSAGNRMQGIIQRLNSQILTLEQNTGRSQRNVGNYASSIINSFSGIAAAFGITFGLQQIVSFGQELFGIAKKAEGIELAFSKIGDNKDLERLRVAVKGTVSDLELMGIAVRADKFRIPMDVLAKGLEFSRQRAIDLGKDVDYMVNSFVNGIGRKSKLVMDNLGISASELSVEVKKTGDFATAVGNIMEREMAKGGIAVDTLADKSGRLATVWENLKKKVGDFFNSQKLNTDRIADLTKSGNIDLNQSTYTTRLRLIAKQSEDMRKLAEERLKKEKEISELEGKYGTGTQVSIEKARLREIIERQLAEKNIYNSMVGQNNAMNEQYRTAKGLLSLDELRQKAKQKREDADSIVINGKKDEDEVRRLYREADELEKQANRFSAKAIKKDNAEIKSRNALQAEIDELNNKGKRKQLDNDQEEIASVEAKYQKLREKAVAFNNDPENKKRGLKVDSGGLVVGESNEKDALRDKQAAAKLKTNLDEQKKLYDEYESYKDKVGKANADKRYATLINTDKTYLEELERQKADISDPQKSKGGTEADVKASEERLKVLDKEIAAETLAQQKKQDQLLTEFISYSDERKALTEKYQSDLLTIGDNPGSREKRTKRYNDELKELDFANLKKLESYEALFVGIDKLSEKSALKQLEFARKALDKDVLSGAITDPEEIAKIKSYFNEVEKTIREGSGKALQDLGSELQNVASSVGEVNQGFGKMLGVLASVVSKVGEIKGGIKDFNKAKADGNPLGQLTAGLGILGAGVGIFSSIFKLFDRSAQREEQAAYARDLQNKQTEALNKALERQVALLDDAYGTDRINKYSEAIKQAQENEAKYSDQLTGRLQLTEDKELNKIIERLNSGGKIGDIFATLRFVNAQKAGQISQLPTDIESLQKLLDEGKLDASTSTIVQNLIEANKTAQDLANNLRAENVGAGLGTIVDEFFTALEDGGTSLEDTLQKSIRRGLLEGLKGELTQKYIQDFYSQLDSALKDGKISSEEDKQLKDLYAAAEAYGKNKLDYINSIAPDSKDGGSSSSLAKSITQITSDQASALEGITRGTYDQTKVVATNTALLIPISKGIGEIYNIAKANFDVMVKVETNTANTVAELQNAVTELKAINTNTKGGSVRGAGLI
jgi:hypothetical protein